MVNLTIKKNQFVPNFFPLLLDYSHRWEFYCGSAGSGKSYSIAQKIIIRCCQEKVRVLVCRRYATTLRNSCFALFKEILNNWKLSEYVKIKETDFSIHFPNGSEIIMVGLDTEEKLLSLTNISVVWVEEAFEVEKEKIEQLNLRMRGQAANQQIILSWNPISKSSYLYNFTVENPPESSIFHHSTYKGNPFLNEEYVKALDEMEIRNPEKYRIYGRGEWGLDPSGLVIKNWKTQEFDPLELAASGLEHRAGLDIGFIDPTAIIDTLYDKQNKTIYVFNEFYKSGCQLSDIVQAIENMNIKKTKIYCDAADPRAIDYFKRNGVNAAPCIKGKNSVKTGYMFLQDHLIIVSPKCEKFINELENFSYVKSKQTGEYTEDTTHEFSHAIDACRYAYSDIYTKGGFKTLDKSLLGL